MAAMDLSPEAVLAYKKALESAEGASFGLVYSQQGDVLAVVDEDGLMVEAIDYDLYGAHSRSSDFDGQSQPCTASATASCPSSIGATRGYGGRFYSSFSGHYEMRARSYDPLLRLWYSPDPLGLVDGYDPWAFVGGDPMNYRDPLGLSAENGEGSGFFDPWDDWNFWDFSSLENRREQYVREEGARGCNGETTMGEFAGIALGKSAGWYYINIYEEGSAAYNFAFGDSTWENYLDFRWEKGKEAAVNIALTLAPELALAKYGKSAARGGSEVLALTDDGARALGASERALIPNRLGTIDRGILQGRIESGKFLMVGETKAAGTFDYVVTADGQILIGSKHSFLSGGSGVQAAGTLKIRSGKIVNIDNASGHYTPTQEEASNFLKVFQESGVDVSSAHLRIYGENGRLIQHVAPNAKIRGSFL